MREGFGGLGGALGGFLGKMFGGGDGSEYSGQIPGIYKKYLGPYAAMGGELIPGLEQGYKGMMDPGAFLGKMGAGFKEDPGYQFNLHQSLGAANQAAAAGGMAGSPMAQQQAGQVASNMANQQYQQYVHNAMGAYEGGLGGLGGLERQGFEGAGDLASGLSNYLQNQANQKLAQQQKSQNEWGSMFGAAGSFLGSFL